MKVIATINGSITAENMALYAFKYAEIQNYSLVLLYVENPKDTLSDVQISVKRILARANSEKISIEFITLSGETVQAIQGYLSTVHADIIFCSTRKENRFIRNSFSELLIKMESSVDIAVVRIVKMSNIMNLDKMLLSIKEEKLSVKKFTFFATLASAYEADGEVYSVSSMSRLELALLDVKKTKSKLDVINFNLRHYMKLAHYMPFTLYIKHDLTTNESESVLAHIARSNAQLVVIGGARLSVKSLLTREMPIEKLMRETSVNMIAYYAKQDQ